MYRQHSNGGFFLVDVVGCMLIISIALVVIPGLFIQAVRINAIATDYTAATNLAQKQLELLKVQPPEFWSTLELPCTLPWQDNEQVPEARYALTTQASISPIDPQLVQVIVTTCWKEAGKDYSIQLVTFYSTITKP